MFYLKRFGKHLEITDENVFTTCPICGREHKVNIQELFQDFNGFDLYSTAVYCRDCAAKRQAELAR